MLWYPYEQMKSMRPPYKITGAQGIYLETNGRRLIDSVSSWWSVIHGYNHPRLNAALHEQIDRFSHVMLGGLSHEPAEALAQKLADWLPGSLNHSFFSDSGSVAVEVALKMALQYYMNLGEGGRTKVLALNHAYHGDTFKTMAVGDDEDYHFVLKAYGPSPHVIHIPTDIAALEKAFDDHHHELNAMIVEPLLQGAGGMRVYDVSFLERARKLCDQYGVILIFDEVATGFGRTGHRFVADLVTPDILVLGKALTGGYMGHAVTVANDRIFQAFWSDEADHALMHGPTFMANALACRLALASITLFEEEGYMDKIRRMEKILQQEWQDFTAPGVRDVRILGPTFAIEADDPRRLSGYQSFAYERGVFARPFLNVCYAMPPYIIDDASLIHIIDTAKAWFLQD